MKDKWNKKVKQEELIDICTSNWDLMELQNFFVKNELLNNYT